MKKEFAISFIVFALLLSSVITSLIPKYFPTIRIEGCVLAFTSGFLIFYCSFRFKKISNKLNTSISFNAIDILIVLLYTYIFTRFAFSTKYNIDLGFIVVVTTGVFFYFYFRFDLLEKKICKIKNILNIILIFGLLQCFYAILQFFSIVPNLLGYRIGGTFGNPGDFANFIIISYAVALGLLRIEKNNINKWLLLSSVIILFVLIILSKARTAWISMLIITLLLSRNRIHSLAIQVKKKLSSKAIFISAFGIFLMGALLLINVYKFKQGSSEGRLFIWKRCIELIAEKPITGSGYESFLPKYNTVQAQYFKANPNDEKNSLLAGDIFYAYNDYLQFTIEYGLLGVLLLLLILIHSLKIVTNKSNDYNPLMHITNIAIIGIMACMLFSYPLQNISIYLALFILIGIKSSFKNTNFQQIKIGGGKVLTSIFILFNTIFFIAAITFISYGCKWDKSYTRFVNRDIECIEEYKMLYKVLKHDRAFLFNYSALLHSFNKFEDCINLIEKHPDVNKDYESLMIRGDCYKQQKEYDKAEEYYSQASNTTPHLFMPKYYLFKLYGETKQELKQRRMAIVIQEMKIKVFSEKVRKIKTEIDKYLINYNSLHNIN